MKLNKYNVAENKFFLAGQEFSLNQIIQLQKILKKLGNLNLTKIYQNLKSKYDCLEDKTQVDAKNLKSTVAAAKKDAAVELAYRKIFFNSKLPAESMRLFNAALDTNLTVDELGIIFKPDLSASQIKVAMDGIFSGLDGKQISSFLNSKLSVNQMEVLREQLFDTPPEIVAMFAKPDLPPRLMTNLISETSEKLDELLSNASRDFEDLTLEEKKHFIEITKENYESSKFTDVNIEMNDGEFKINGKITSQSDLEDLLSSERDSRTLKIRLALATDEVIPDEVKTVTSGAITAALGLIAIEQIGMSPNFKEAKDIFVRTYGDLTGVEIEYGRDLKNKEKSKVDEKVLERTKN